MKKISFNELVEPTKHLTWWVEWGELLLGCLSMAAGFVYFINPYKLVPGGVYGASIVLHNIFPSIQVGTFGYMFDIPLLITAMLLLGANIGGRTILAALITPAIMNLLSSLSYPSHEALEALDPALLLNGIMDLSDHILLSTIIGSVLIGIGSGLIVRSSLEGSKLERRPGLDKVVSICINFSGCNCCSFRFGCNRFWCW